MISHHGEYELTMKVGDRIRIKGDRDDRGELGTIDSPGSIFDWKVVLDIGNTLSAFNEVEMEVVEVDNG